MVRRGRTAVRPAAGAGPSGPLRPAGRDRARPGEPRFAGAIDRPWSAAGAFVPRSPMEFARGVDGRRAAAPPAAAQLRPNAGAPGRRCARRRGARRLHRRESAIRATAAYDIPAKLLRPVKPAGRRPAVMRCTATAANTCGDTRRCCRRPARRAPQQLPQADLRSA